MKKVTNQRRIGKFLTPLTAIWQALSILSRMFSMPGRVIIWTSLFFATLAVLVILVLSRIPAETKLVLNVRADNLSFDQLSDFTWFGDSIAGNELVFENAVLKVGASQTEINEGDKPCFQSSKNEEMEIHLANDGYARLLRSEPHKLAISRLTVGTVVLNPIEVPRDSTVSLSFERDPMKITLSVKRGLMRGKINSREFYLRVTRGEAKVAGKICKGDLVIKGKSLIEPPLTFKTDSKGFISIIEPQAERNRPFLNESFQQGINNVHVRIAPESDSQPKKSYIKYYAVNSTLPASTLEYVEGDEFSVASEKNLDINVLRISSSGIDFSARTRAKKIQVDNRLVSPSLLDTLQRKWILIVGILFFVAKDVVLAIALKTVSVDQNGRISPVSEG